ncbi:MAG: hypothetical protein E5V60_15160 [Mesorhizobium sp.]|nr:MAG: hypothetical protein E5V60_15160 [Mesorhizobium sp.]
MQARTGRWDGETRGITIKRQAYDFPLHDDCRFGFGPPAIAYGACFLGAQSGLGQPRPYTHRGDVRRVEEPEFAVPPADVETVIEAILARATVAGVGDALGARGGYADRRGRKALMDAARWAKVAIANDNRLTNAKASLGLSATFARF